MAVYYFVLFYVIFFIFISNLTKNKRLVFSNHILDKNRLFLFFIAIGLICVSGLRYKVGTDYDAYIINYDYYKTPGLQSLGCRVIAILSSWIKDDYATWFFLMAFLTIGLCVYAINKKKDYWQLAILLFLFMGYWHASFNIVKQCAAMAILIACQDYLLEKNFVKWVVACIIASLFHVSAILMIPVFFLVTRSITIKQLFVTIVVGVVISFGYQQLFDLMSLLKTNEAMESIDSAVGARRVNYLRVLVNVIPALLMIPLRKEYRRINYSDTLNYEDKRNNTTRFDAELTVWSNFSLLNAVICVAAMNSVYLTRFCNYTGIFNIFFIPFSLKIIQRRLDKYLVLILYCILFICYFAFWIYDLSKGSTTSYYHWIFER